MKAGVALGQRRSSRRTAVVCRAAAKNFYDILGVPSSASDREIKSAYRKLAMKLHPDVNKAPDAQKRFMEVKVAYETLSDDKQRAEYDRRLRGGYGGGRAGYAGSGSNSSGFGSTYGSNSYGTGGGNPYGNYGNYGNYTQEPLPGLDDLIRELEKEFTAWAKERAAKADKAGGRPKTLAEELEDLGGEFLDFLEEALGIKEEAGGSSSSSSSGTSTSTGAAAGAAFRETAKSAAEQFDAWWQQYGDGSPLGGSSNAGARSGANGGSSSGGASSAGSRSTSTGASSSSSTYSSSYSRCDRVLLAVCHSVGQSRMCVQQQGRMLDSWNS
ncbi:hypothetical protein HYH02_004841 [Chlamydomonas schloesseri]|uniref:J domain-containing protein n=1 Tax=Chlamydomonas schloesseri TaxID=2026947 RepID=A0A836B7W4_9CHLO|nr:hypothetical protein HYH02_004841 [Chlamydomonas schloesseri]|eukprot:KAG2450336.1 hypothetical protein HYH02_004841 [Chlamydomonas schloesseri]